MTNRAEQLAVAAAPLIDGAWRYNKRASEDHPWKERFVLTDDSKPGRAIEFAPFTKYGERRLKIYGILPRSGRYGGHSFSITVSQSRDGLAIARDINRRLLPVYLKQWTAKQVEINAYNASSQEHLHKIELLRPVCPGLYGQYNSDINANTTDFHFSYGGFTMHRNYEHFSLRLDIDYETALQVLHFVKELKIKKVE